MENAESSIDLKLTFRYTFSFIYLAIPWERTVGYIPSPKAGACREIQIATSLNWSQVDDSISYNDDGCTNRMVNLSNC